MEKLNIIVGSKAGPKTEAAQKAMEKSGFDPADFLIIPTPAKSEVHDQPAGLHEINLGCTNRLRGGMELSKSVVSTAALIITSENGIVPRTDQYSSKELGTSLIGSHIGTRFIPEFYLEDTEEYWYDLAASGILHPTTGTIKTNFSDKVEFPVQYVRETWEKGENKRDGFISNTVGQTLADRGIVENHQDPHVDLGSRIPREEILIKAYMALIAIAKQKSWL